MRRLALGTLMMVLLSLGVGCSKSDTKVTVGNGGKPRGVGPKLEVDAALAKAGINVQETQREDKKLVLSFQSTQKDHESTNYSYALYGPDGMRMGGGAFSVPSFAKGETREWELMDDDLPNASRLVIGIFGK
jgi:hypothetical protein